MKLNINEMYLQVDFFEERIPSMHAWYVLLHMIGNLLAMEDVE